MALLLTTTTASRGLFATAELLVLYLLTTPPTYSDSSDTPDRCEVCLLQPRSGPMRAFTFPCYLRRHCRLRGQRLPNMHNAHTHSAASLRVTCVPVPYRMDSFDIPEGDQVSPISSVIWLTWRRLLRWSASRFCKVPPQL